MAGRRIAASVVASALVVTAAAGAAGADKEKIALNAQDDALARAGVLRKSDLSTKAVWKGGATKPALASALSCSSFHPKQSDLVVTGAAQTVWTTTGVELDSEAQVLKTARMVALDWGRTVVPAAVLPCMRETFRKQLGASGTKLVSITRTSFPRLAPFSARFRVLADVPSSGTKVRLLVDLVLVGRGRTEITLTTTAPYAAQAAVGVEEQRLAALLVARARA